MAFQFNVQDEAAVNQWKERAQQLNDKAARLVTESAQALAEFQNTATGKIFDEVVVLSDSVIQGTNKVLEGMTQMLDGVTGFVNLIKQKIRELANDVLDTKSRVVN